MYCTVASLTGRGHYPTHIGTSVLRPLQPILSCAGVAFAVSPPSLHVRAFWVRVPLRLAAVSIGGRVTLACSRFHGLCPGIEEMVCAAAIGQDLCLIGPRGEGKTFLAQQFARCLGYSQVHTLCLGGRGGRLDRPRAMKGRWHPQMLDQTGGRMVNPIVNPNLGAAAYGLIGMCASGGYKVCHVAICW